MLNISHPDHDWAINSLNQPAKVRIWNLALIWSIVNNSCIKEPSVLLSCWQKAGDQSRQCNWRRMRKLSYFWSFQHSWFKRPIHRLCNRSIEIHKTWFLSYFLIVQTRSYLRCIRNLHPSTSPFIPNWVLCNQLVQLSTSIECQWSFMILDFAWSATVKTANKWMSCNLATSWIH